MSEVKIKSTLNPGQDYDLIVIGAGVVGSAAATAFGKQGRKVLLIERDLSEPDRIVGELLQPGGVMALEKLGLDHCLNDIDAITCHGYAVFYRGQPVDVPYPTRDDGNKAIGRSFHHGKFIMNLRKAASEVPTITIFEGTASEILLCPITNRALGVSVTPKGQSEITKNFFAPLTIVADGCYSKFRKEFVPRSVQVKSNFVGFILRDCMLPFPNRGHVLLCKTSPTLMYQIGTHETRVLVDVPGKLPSNGSGALKKYLESNVLPEIPPSVQSKFYEAIQTERLRSMPNSFLPPSTNTHEGLIMLGDAMNMRHPLTGGGMTVGLNDVVTLAEMLSPTEVPDLVYTGLILEKMEDFHWKRKRTSSVINVLAQALYSLFAAADDSNIRVLQDGCFNYFLLGGNCITGPISLLSGLCGSPLVLTYHFFAVAVYGIYLFITTRPFLEFPLNIVRGFIILYTAAAVIFPVLLTELYF